MQKRLRNIGLIGVIASGVLAIGCASTERREEPAPAASAPASQPGESASASDVMIGRDTERAIALIEDAPPPARREPAVPARRSPVNQPRGGRP